MSEALRFTESQVHDSGVEAVDVPIVPVGTLLVDLAQVFARHEGRHVLVQDSNGELTGIVSTDELRNAMRNYTDNDVAAWHQRTVESLLTVTLTNDSERDERDVPAASARKTPASEFDFDDCLTLHSGDDLIALMTREDVLLSWNRLEPALARAATDTLTRLPNRRHFERRFQEEWQRASRLNLTLGLIIIDIDSFKDINDRFGHLRGDMVLASIAECCQRQLRSYDLVARYAGDEFIAVTCGCQPEDIDLPIRRLQQAVRDLGLRFNGELVPTTLSIGAAVARAGGDSLDKNDLIEAADACLYRSKREGRDRAHRIEISATGVNPQEVASAVTV